jgi:hypothetical protein
MPIRADDALRWRWRRLGASIGASGDARPIRHALVREHAGDIHDSLSGGKHTRNRQQKQCPHEPSGSAKYETARQQYHPLRAGHQPRFQGEAQSLCASARITHHHGA